MTQNQALDVLKLGHNVFLTGPAGSGKTYLLNEYIEYLKSHKVAVGITASTGIAATHIGGTTIHSWSGMGIRDVITVQDLKELFKRSYLRKRFTHTRILIIDEISMLHANQLDMVDQICRAFKKVDLPFGGMQVVMCGDFFQLPPVTKVKRHAELDSASISSEIPNLFQNTRDKQVRDNDSLNFVTGSKVWRSMDLKVCYLDEQYRQDDRNFLRVLNDIRNSEVTDATVEILTERLNKDTKGYARPTRLFSHNVDADKINAEQLEKLLGEHREFFMSSRGSPGISDILKKSCLAPERLVLKVGAQVMFVKNNYDVGYVNGTLGEVIDFSMDDLPLVRTFDGAEIVVHHASWEVKEEQKELAAIAQIPLRLAWAITVHKSQGMSLDAAEIDLSRSFVPGMGYVALSRVRSLSGLKLLGMNQMSMMVAPVVAKMDREFIQKSHEVGLYLKNLKDSQKQKLQKEFLEKVINKKNP